MEAQRQNSMILTESEAARTLEVSVSGLRKWRREGTGPQFIRIGRLVRYDLSDMQDWLAARKEGSSEQSSTSSAVEKEHSPNADA